MIRVIISNLKADFRDNHDSKHVKPIHFQSRAVFVVIGLFKNHTIVCVRTRTQVFCEDQNLDSRYYLESEPDSR